MSGCPREQGGWSRGGAWPECVSFCRGSRMAGATLTPEGCSLHRAEHLPYRGVGNGPAQGVGHRPCAVGRRMGSGAFHWRELVPSRPQLGHLKVLEPCANGRPAMPWGRPSWCEWHCLGFRLGTNPLGREMRGYHSMRPQQGEAKEPGPIPSPPPPCCSTLGPSRWASLATTLGGGDGCMGPLGSQLRGACLCWGGLWVLQTGGAGRCGRWQARG